MQHMAAAIRIGQFADKQHFDEFIKQDSQQKPRPNQTNDGEKLIARMGLKPRKK